MSASPDFLFKLPTVPLHVPTWALLAIGALVLLALAFAGSVFAAGRKMEVSRHHVLSFFQTLLWVIPAVVVVGLVGFSTRAPVPPPTVTAEAPVATTRDPNLIFSRTVSSEVPEFARPPEDQPEKGVARFAKGLVRFIKRDSQTADFLVFSSDPFVTEEDAARSLTPKIAEVVQEQLDEGFLPANGLAVSVPLIEQHGVRESVLEQFDKDLGIGKTRLVRLHVAVQVTPELREAVHREWKTQVVSNRLTQYGAGVGVMTTLTALIAGYLALNTMTQGQYRWRLRLAALTGLSAAVLLGWQAIV
jgi:hypothetical protein